MNTWMQFLTDQGAVMDDSGADILRFAMETENTPAADFISPLTHLGFLAASSEEAASFLHSQLTNDVLHLPQHGYRLAGYCSPKGRLLATFQVWRDQETIVLQSGRDVLPQVLKRLQMFVLRSKVKLLDESDSRIALGLAGPKAAAQLSALVGVLPDTPGEAVECESGLLFRAADAGAPRFQWVGGEAAACGMWKKLSQHLQPTSGRAWRLAEIRAGLPWIVKATQEQFVPQMVNYELVGGVNFKKGCYPGQEIVARSQYLGKLKRRTLLASIPSADAAAGMELYSSKDPDQPCGMVVNAERETAAASLCLAELKLSATDDGSIHLGSPSGPELHLRDLPYPLAEPQ